MYNTYIYIYTWPISVPKHMSPHRTSHTSQQPTSPVYHPEHQDPRFSTTEVSCAWERWSRRMCIKSGQIVLFRQPSHWCACEIPNRCVTRISTRNERYIQIGCTEYFTNLGFPEIRGFPLLNQHFPREVVFSVAMKFDQINIPSSSSSSSSSSYITITSINELTYAVFPR